MTTPHQSMQDGETDTGFTATFRDDDVPELTSHEVTENRIVFTEEENSDGWIATDLTVMPSE